MPHLRFSRPRWNPSFTFGIATIPLLVLCACEKPPDAEPNQAQIHQVLREQERHLRIHRSVLQSAKKAFSARLSQSGRVSTADGKGLTNCPPNGGRFKSIHVLRHPFGFPQRSQQILSDQRRGCGGDTRVVDTDRLTCISRTWMLRAMVSRRYKIKPVQLTLPGRQKRGPWGMAAVWFVVVVALLIVGYLLF